MRTTLIAAALAALLAAAGAACGDGGGDDGGFSDEVRRSYLEGCLADGTDAFCTCTLEGFEQAFTEDEFERLGRDLVESGQPPAEFVDVIDDCLPELEGG